MRSTPSERGIQALQSILLHATEAQMFVQNMTKEEFRQDRLTFHAATRCLEIISEASRRLEESMKARHPSLPWRDIADAGNFYRHEYDDVASDFVFKTVTKDLAALVLAARTELGQQQT